MPTFRSIAVRSFYGKERVFLINVVGNRAAFVIIEKFLGTYVNW